MRRLCGADCGPDDGGSGLSARRGGPPRLPGLGSGVAAWDEGNGMSGISVDSIIPVAIA